MGQLGVYDYKGLLYSETKIHFLQVVFETRD